MAKELKKDGIIAFLDPILTYNIDALEFTSKWEQFDFHNYRYASNIWEGETYEDLLGSIARKLKLKNIEEKPSKCCY